MSGVRSATTKVGPFQKLRRVSARDRAVFTAGAIFALNEMIVLVRGVANHAANVDPIGSEAGVAALDALIDEMKRQKRRWSSAAWFRDLRKARVKKRRKGGAS